MAHPADSRRPAGGDAARRRAERGAGRSALPEENLLYFLEKFSPQLQDWERELLRIVRNIAQYFFPQRQTKVMNEGCATYVHYKIMNRLYDLGLISEGAMLEFLASHTGVVFQPDFDDRRYGGINPYALGFEMMHDIERIATDPTEEDRLWFPEFAGNGDAYGTLREAWANYRDDSFIPQFLSPQLMRDFRLFKVIDDAEEEDLQVDAIHDERGYREIRRALSRHYDLARREPDIQVTDADLSGDRTLTLTHTVHDSVLLDQRSSAEVLKQIAYLWKYRVVLREVDARTDEVLNVQEVPAAAR